MRIAALTFGLVAALACSKAVKVETNPSAGKIDVDVQKPGAPEIWNGALASVGGSTVTGTATGSTAHDSSHVTVNIMRAASQLRWHMLRA